MAQQAVERVGQNEDAQHEHRRAARQVDEQRHAERRAGKDHRHEAPPFGAHCVPGVFQPDAERAAEIDDREERQREGERHKVRRERNGDQRRAEAGDAEDQRADEGEAREQRGINRHG